MSVCFDSSGIPIPCSGWTVYDSYVTDPRYQKYFTIAWCSILGLAFITTLPSIVKFSVRGQFGQSFGTWQGLFGVFDDSTTTKGYERVQDRVSPPPPTQYRKRSTITKPFLAVSTLIRSFTRTAPRLPFSKHYSTLSTGHLFLLILIPLIVLATLFPESRLAENPNRFGFLALACIPPLFVLSSKNGAVSLLLGRSWTAVNFLHRWLGRAVLLLVICHFALWSVQWARAGELSEFLSSSKERRGLGAFAFLLLITISSLPPMRRFSYPIFFTLHYISILGFLVFLNQHTIYARGWATYSVVGIYAVDIIGRLASVRIRWVEVEALEGGMTKVGMRGVKGGWVGGQTIDLRLFFVPPVSTNRGGSRIRGWIEYGYRSVKAAARPFESHPFSIATAPPSRSVGGMTDEGRERGIEVFAKSCGQGTWTDDLYEFASASSSTASSYEPLSSTPTSPSTASKPGSRSTHVLALFFGPYASSISTYSSPELFEEKETVSFFAGGSGMSYVMGVLEELVGRRVTKGKGGQVEVVWVVRELAHVTWFLPRLETILSSIPPSCPLSVSLQIHVTSPDSSSPPFLSSLPPHTTLTCSRPNLPSILSDQISKLLSPCSHCYPVCKCGDGEGQGVCANEEEECVGGSGGVGNGTELLFDTRGGQLGESGTREVEKNEDEIDQLPEAGSERPSTRCCGGGDPRSRQITKGEKSCCGDGGKGCCSSQYPPPSKGASSASVREASTPLRVKNGGMSVIVCGPSRMTSEVRNAVARIPMAHQIRIGGVGLVVEHYGI